MTTENQTPATRPAVVTIDDVRQQLEILGLDARKTNASVIQKALGRGGMGTVQKHLDTIRAELDQPVPVLDGEIPPAPKEATDAIWRAAYSAAHKDGLVSLGMSLLERDDARKKLERSIGDVVAWEAAKDDADAAAVAAEAAKAEAEAKATAAEAAAEAAKMALEAEIAGRAADAQAAQDRAAQAMSAVKAAHEVEISHAETKIVTLQATIDRLVNQLSDVKSLLPRVVAEESVKGE